MKLFITGATGLIGHALITSLSGNNEIVALTRDIEKAKQSQPTTVSWIDDIQQLSNFNGFDGVINLAGEPIVDKRWSKHRKQVLVNSRLDTTRKLVALINASSEKPRVFISGSAIGYYGRQNSQAIDESFSSPFNEFSHHLCHQWEQCALQANQHTRVCILRTGIVLSAKGGALAKMLPVFRLGLGGPIGNGKQMMSWIHIKDMVDGIQHLLHDSSLDGVFNLTSPGAVSNREFSKTLGTALNRPALLTMPGFVMKALMGEMADLLLFGQNVKPQRLIDSGFTFTHTNINKAFLDLIN